MKRKVSKASPQIADAAIDDNEVGRKAVSLSALREQAAGLRRAQQMAGLAHVVTMPDGSFQSWSETLPQLIGVAPEAVVSSTRKWLDLVHPADRELFRSAALRARTDGKRTELEYRLWCGQGAWVHVRQVMEPIPGEPDEQGRLRWFNTLQDLTKQKQSEQSIKRLNRVYAVLSGINSLIVRVRSCDELFQEACNLAVEKGDFRLAWIGLVEKSGLKITRAAEAGDVRDFMERERLSLVEGASDFGMAGKVVNSLRSVISQDAQRDPNRVHKKDYAERRINSICLLPLIVGGQGIGVMALYATEIDFFDDEEMRLLHELAADVSFAVDHIEKSQRAEHLAYYDALTGLANRTLFHERLGQQLEAAREHGHNLALAIADVQRFKTINDTVGRQAGDDLLIQVAERLVEHLLPGRVARIGPDLFAFMVPDVSSEELARRIEDSLKTVFGQPFAIGDGDLRVSARLGVALYPNDGANADALFRNAEAALKKAKKGSDRYVFYEEKMTGQVSEHLALENKLRWAIERKEFVLHYQPKVELESRRVVGIEALIRWQSPDLGLVPPLKFIGILEETGMILDVGAWAMRQAARDHQALTNAGIEAPRVAVNVSAIQLRQRDFVATVEDAIAAGISPTGLDLELTESVLMDDIEANIAKLMSLRSLGLELSIDDFGTGYSSLAYLAKLPVQALKIDRSFIKGMQDDPNAMTLVTTMISLAHSLNLKAVAEGVETEDQARNLRLFRCHEMQGYLISKPLPFDELLALLRQRR